MTTDQEAPTDIAPLPPVDVWLVDGFNVLHAVVLGGEPRGRFWERGSRDRLVDRLAQRRDVSVEIVLVFDGKHPVEGDEAHPAPGLELVFAPSADDWIVARVRASDSADRVGVVTRDRQVGGRCRHAGATVLAPGDFLAALPRADSLAPGASPVDSAGAAASEAGEEQQHEQAQDEGRGEG